MAVWIQEIAIMVRDLDEAVRFYTDIIGLRLDADRVVLENTPGLARYATFEIHPVGRPINLNLVAPVGPESTLVNRSIERHGEGLHHYALELDDLEGTFKRVTEAGIRLVGPDGSLLQPGGKVGYTDPRKTHGTVIELIPMGHVAPLRPLESK